MKREQLWASIASSASSEVLLALPLTLAIYHVDPTCRRFVRLACQRWTQWTVVEFGESAHLVRSAALAGIDILMTHWHGDKSSERLAPMTLCREILSDRRAQRRFGPALIATSVDGDWYKLDEETRKFVLTSKGRELARSFDAIGYGSFDIDEWRETVFSALRSAASDIVH